MIKKGVKIGAIFVIGCIFGLPLFNGTTSATTQVEQSDATNDPQNEKCVGIKLNTDVPFVGNCISVEKKTDANKKQATQIDAFGRLMGGLMKFTMTVILVMGLLMIVAAGVLIATGGYDKSQYSKGIELIKKVAIGMALLGASGVILKVINPNFFT